MQSIDCSCIKGARSEGVSIPYGTNAVELVGNSIPTIGGLVLFKYTESSHVAKIKSFEEDGFWVVESNYLPCQKTERFVSWKDPFISGFWSSSGVL